MATAEPPVLEGPTGRAIAEHARSAAAAAVAGRSAPASLPANLAAWPVYGVFVTLKRGDTLRACRGRWSDGDGTALGDLLGPLAAETALRDHRFPAVTPFELPFLHVEVSLLHAPERLVATGPDRVNEVSVGEHGLLIRHPRGRGVLLPQVATEQGWDAATFLARLAGKANLPAEAWASPEAEVIRFRAAVAQVAPQTPELAPAELDAGRRARLLQSAADPSVDGTLLYDEVLDRVRPEPLALSVHAADGAQAAALGRGESLLALAQRAGAALRRAGAGKPRAYRLFYQPLPLSPDDAPARRAAVGGHPVLAETERGQTFAFPHRGDADPATAALAAVGGDPASWQMGAGPRLTAFRVLAHGGGGAGGARPAGEPADRAPARAGQFYPADAEAVSASLARMLAEAGDAPERAPRAVMLPHAGWRFCGPTIARTLAGVRVPETAVVIGPKHTPHGPNRSIPPHAAWRLPGDRVPIAAELAGPFLETAAGFAREAEAHRLEHGTEVLIPFLRARNPRVRVLPVVLGPCDYEGTAEVAAALRSLLATESPPLIVVSSDMNHFASAAETERRDELALAAIASRDPRRLYDTCRANEISMCGMHAAVSVMRALDDALAPERVDYRHTGHTTGDFSSVVGYAGVRF